MLASFPHHCVTCLFPSSTPHFSPLCSKLKSKIDFLVLNLISLWVMRTLYSPNFWRSLQNVATALKWGQTRQQARAVRLSESNVFGRENKGCSSTLTHHTVPAVVVHVFTAQWRIISDIVAYLGSLSTRMIVLSPIFAARLTFFLLLS